MSWTPVMIAQCLGATAIAVASVINGDSETAVAVWAITAVVGICDVVARRWTETYERNHR